MCAGTAPAGIARPKNHKAPGNCPGLSYSQTIVRSVAPGTTELVAYAPEHRPHCRMKIVVGSVSCRSATDQRAELAHVEFSEVVIVTFHAQDPIRGQHDLDAAAGSPACSCDGFLDEIDQPRNAP